jgi:hypothetical protein
MKKHTITLNQDQIEYLNDLLLAEAESRVPSEDNYNIGDHDFNDLFYRVRIKTEQHAKVKAEISLKAQQ